MTFTTTRSPRTKFGTVVATVARMFVPNCSAATVTNTICQFMIERPCVTSASPVTPRSRRLLTRTIASRTRSYTSTK
jgi:hypothetical protein